METVNVTDWGEIMIAGAVIYFGYSIYSWWKKDGRKKWKNIAKRIDREL
jgi:hypothetical protein